MTITINNQEIKVTNEQMEILKKALNLNSKRLADVPVGDTFMIAGIEFIHFGDGKAVAKDILFSKVFDKGTNNFAKSSLLDRLKTDVLPRIENEVGAENILEFETDLWALDGTDKYGSMMSKISLPTFDFYRQNKKIFEKYPVNNWWLLATPDSTKNSSVRCVNIGGTLGNCNCNYINGVRPVLFFKSDIFVS